MGVIFKAGSAHAITLSLFISLSVWLIIVWLYWWPNSLWKKRHESDQTEWERESALRGLNANAGAQFSALPWSFFKMNLDLHGPSSQSLNLPNTTFPKQLFTWARLAGFAKVNFYLGNYYDPGITLSRYRSEFQLTGLAGMSCDHKVDFYGV